MQIREVRTIVHEAINDVVRDERFVQRVTEKGTGLFDAFRVSIEKDSAKLSEEVQLKAIELVDTASSTAHSTASKVRGKNPWAVFASCPMS